MSSPLSSLKNGKKIPLLPGRRPAPFKYQEQSVEAVLNEQINLPKSEYSRKPMQKQGPNDKELLSSMMNRLARAEQSLQSSQETIKEKEKRIRILEDKCRIMDKARGYGNEQVLELEKKCKRLQKKIHSMEKFLEDYGMVWVGDEEDSDEEKPFTKDANYDQLEPLQSSQTPVWNPGASVASAAPLEVNFDLIIKNIEELNTLAGEGEHIISHTTRGARLKLREPVPLTLYANGIFMFNGPFRPYSDPETQTYINDILDGYFPSELQSRFPNGVPFSVTDLRDTHFRDGRQDRFFTGAGQKLLDTGFGDTSNKVTQTIDEGIKETCEPPGHQKQTIDQFLNKLPSKVIKNGKIVDIKSDLKDKLKGSDSTPSETIMIEEGEKQTDNQKRIDQAGKMEIAQSDITTIRVKSEKGDKTYIIKMKYSDTIGDLRRQINKMRQQKMTNYKLKSSFPNQIYDDDNATLEDCGLVPNATLHILAKR